MPKHSARQTTRLVMTSPLRRIASSLAIPVLFGGYLIALHYGWQRLQYSPVVNGGGEPATLSIEKFRKVFFGRKSNSESKDNKEDGKK